jgi:predicted NUDIX family NTP pyrophosphohydrolase
MAIIAAGLLMCRTEGAELQFFLVHPGGPFYVKKNEGVWSIPKGLPENNEEILQTAQREFFEETGIKPSGPYHPLGSIKQKSGKIVYAWAFIGEWTSDRGIVSNIFKIEWPPRSKKFIDIPEVDKAEWMSYDQACKMIHPHQLPFLTKAKEIFKSHTPVAP